MTPLQLRAEHEVGTITSLLGRQGKNRSRNIAHQLLIPKPSLPLAHDGASDESIFFHAPKKQNETQQFKSMLMTEAWTKRSDWDSIRHASTCLSLTYQQKRKQQEMACPC